MKFLLSKIKGFARQILGNLKEGEVASGKIPWFWLGLAAIFCLSLTLRFWGLKRFNTVVFDEVTYVQDIHAMGNPVLWWLSTFAIIFTVGTLAWQFRRWLAAKSMAEVPALVLAKQRRVWLALPISLEEWQSRRWLPSW